MDVIHSKLVSHGLFIGGSRVRTLEREREPLQHPEAAALFLVFESSRVELWRNSMDGTQKPADGQRAEAFDVCPFFRGLVLRERERCGDAMPGRRESQFPCGIIYGDVHWNPFCGEVDQEWANMCHT